MVGAVGGPSCWTLCGSGTVAGGGRGPVAGLVVCRGTIEGAPGAIGDPGGRRAIVGAAGADLKAMVGAGAGGRGAPAVGAGGGVGTPRTLGPAFKVTRTVSFFKGTADVFFIGVGGVGG